MSAAGAARCRVYPGGMAPGPASRQRSIRGIERHRSASQNRGGQSHAAYTKRDFAALEVSLHDILLQLLHRASWRRKKARLGQLARQSRKTHEFAISLACGDRVVSFQPRRGRAGRQLVRRLAAAKTTASAIQDRIMVVPPIGAAKGKMRSPVKTCIASSAENRIAPASITKPTIRSLRAEAAAIRACAAIASAAAACSRRNNAPLCASLPPFAWTPAAANATPAAPISAATPARIKGARIISGSIADEVGRRGQSSPLDPRLSRRFEPSILRTASAYRGSEQQL